MPERDWGELLNDTPYGVEFHGPFITPNYKLSVHGYLVPHIRGNLVTGTEDTWDLLLDERFILRAEGDEVRRWLGFVANAMAIAAGYSCHGDGSWQANPYKVAISRIESTDPA